MALMADDEVLGHFLNPVSCQPASTAAMYSSSMAAYPPLNHPSLTSVTTSYCSPALSSSTHLAPSYSQGPYWHQPQSSPEMQYSYPLYSAPVTSLSPPHTMHQTASLLPDMTSSGRPSRSPSASSASTFPSLTAEDASMASYTRQPSPGSPDRRAYGYQNSNGTWSCAYEGCTSRAVFTRGCDLRKHYKRHTKSFFCRHEGCPQATGGGFSSKKDLARHEAKHNPGVICEWEGCDRVFSRVDNMVSFWAFISEIGEDSIADATFYRETTSSGYT